MGNFRKNKKRAAKATSSVDKAQNALMKRMNKKLNELESAVETKYNTQYGSEPVSGYDGSTAAGRIAQIYPVEIGVNQGTSDIERIGDQVTFKHLDLEYQVNLPFMRTTEHSQPVSNCRVFLFWDNQPSSISGAGALITNPCEWPQLLQMANDTVTTNVYRKQIMLSQKDWDNRKRYNIIYDKTHTLSPNDSGTTLGLGARSTTGIVSFSKTYVGQKIRYVAGGTIVQNRKLYLAYMSDQEVATGSPALTGRRPTIYYNLRILYDDI